MQIDLYEEELELERNMLQFGKDRYIRETKNAEEQGRSSETSYARRLLSVICNDMSTVLGHWLTNHGPGPGKRSSTKKVLRKLTPECASYITLKTIFDILLKSNSVLQIALHIGQRIEDEIRFNKFQEMHPNLYHFITKEFKERSVVNYRRKHRVLTNAHSRQDNWSGLTVNQRAQIGSVLIEHAIKSTGMFDVKLERKGRKTTRILYLTPDTTAWIEEHITQFALLFPDFSPTVLPPKPWTSFYKGGYYLPLLQKRFPFVKCKSKTQRLCIHKHDFSTAMQAVNKIQETPWRINQFTFSAMQEVWRLNLRIGMPPSEPYEMPECPIPKEITKENMQEHELVVFNIWKKHCSEMYTKETQRVSKCLLLGRILSSGVKYSKYDKFYFVYNCDFRGRIYAASSGFSPQGPDISKGILEFAEGKELGEDGFDWLRVHGANTYGYDKVSYEDRIKWCEERDAQLCLIGTQPFSEGARKVWANADKPYQFLAFCGEYVKARENPKGFISHLPIALDGSCNGLQHFSAMLRDAIGGKAVNLLPGEAPQDIYSDVAKVCIKRLQSKRGTVADPDGHAAKALAFGVDRKVCKKPVMTLPYGSTYRNCVNVTTSYVLDHPETSVWEEDIFKGTAYLAKNIWDSIDDVVIAARAAMKWMRTVTSMVNKLKEPIIFITPSNFKMMQSEMKTKAKLIKTQLLGNIRMQIGEITSEIDTTKQLSGVSPNFVHALDATHLCMTVNATDFSSYAMIHDSFGSHACNTTELAKVLREQFINMYTEHDVLQELKESIEAMYNIELPDVPDKGELDLDEVINSRYFFS